MSHQHRVLHLIDTLSRGGAERMAVEIANASVQDGHQVTLCVTRKGVALAGSLDSGVQLVVLGRRNRVDPRGFAKLAALERDFDPTVIHCHGMSSFSLVAVMKTCGWLRAPVVLHDHFGRSAGAKVPGWFRAVGRRSLARYVAVSRAQEQWAVNAGLPRDRTRVIGNRMSLERILESEPRLPEDLRSAKRPMTGLMVGGVRPEKGLEELIEAAGLVESEVDWRVLVVGRILDRSYLTHCQSRLSSAGLADRFVFAGEREAVPAIVKACDFGVVPSVIDSGPLALIEFLAAGIPIVSTRVGQIAQTAEKAGVVAFVEPRNPVALAAALTEVIHLAPAERAGRGELGRRKAVELFDIRAAMPEYYEVYSEVGDQV